MAIDAPLHRAIEQIGALPVRLHAEGFVEVLLITSRETRRWVIPKGWPMPGCTPAEAAMREAREEAGLIGVADTAPFGVFIYDKRLSSGVILPCRVSVHLLRVTGQLDRWREQGQRDCVWMTSREAAKQVCNLSLQRLIARAGRSPELLRPAVRRATSGRDRIGGATPRLA
jgi:8-oxo-dGTP pyrophosphatase MutT (NUDIX family)